MKKYLFPLIAGLGLAVSAKAAVILDETFTYADGPLTNVSSGVWAIHSGTTPINVVSGKAVISQANSQDNFAQLTGAPYSSGNLYASFVVNFSTVPTSGGTYFAHFKDATTSGFRCRAYAVSTGAAAGNYRVGIARASGTAVIIPTDLSPNTDYVLVLRYDAATGASRLWINPGSEGAVTDLADGTDTWTATPITSFALRQGANNQGICTFDNLKVGTAFTDVVAGGNPALNPPFISNIADQNIPRDGATPEVPFYVTDGETAHANLTLSASSSNTGLVPMNNIVFGPMSPGDSNRTVKVTAAPGQQGASEITATVTDGDNNIATRKFLVIVGAPTISTFSNTTTPTNLPTPAIPFTASDAENDTLTFSATSTNGAVVPVSGIVFGSSGGTSNVTITPAADVSGLSRVTIIASDGFNSVSNSFVITVFPSFHIVLSDGFDYPDGSLTSVSTIWGTHSGTAGDVKVTGGKIFLSGTNSEDVSSTFTNPPSFTAVSCFPHEGWILYSSFDVNFISRPTTSSGEYFAHFRNSGTGTSFGGKVFATTNGAASGKLRLGLSNSANAPANVIWPSDLSTGTTYTVVTRYNVGIGQATLWINPTTVSSPSITATDGAFPFTTETYSFREQSGIGNMYIDNVKVSTSFLDVVGPALTITALGNNVTLSWPSAATGYVLRYTDEFPAVGSPVGADYPDQGTVQGNLKVVTINGVTGNRFFQLQKP
jgi:hypothetical protein